MTAFFPNTLPADTAKLIAKINAHYHFRLDNFYLTGGTALALQLGHRESEDLDFFSPEEFDPESLAISLGHYGDLHDTHTQSGTLNTYINGVKLQFLHYPYPLLKPFVAWEKLQLSDPLDIACTKLQTIASRGSKKDFIDLYVLLELFSLKQLVTNFKHKYAAVDYNLPHILKSLVYFEDADAQPIPRLHRDIVWENVKHVITENVKALDLSSL